MPNNLNSNGHYNLSKEEVSLPCATLKMSAVDNNIAWMQRFAKQTNVLLCPHIKTSLTPAIISKQIEAGAWGVTVATIQQAFVAKACKAKNIILANQLVGKSNFDLALTLIDDNECQLLVCIDSISNASALNDFFQANNMSLNVLVEIGVNGGRCGVRNKDELGTLISFIRSCSNLSLQGIEFYEGVIHSENEVNEIREFLFYIEEMANQYLDSSIFDTCQPIITGAGSAFYDLVVEMFSSLPAAYQKIIRPGCYVSHDTGIYDRAQKNLRTRLLDSNSISCEISGDLISAIEIWAYVQSRPEQNKLIINIGKRDVAFDSDLPKLERAFRFGQPLDISFNNIVATSVMDQHMFLDVPIDCTLEVGDIVVFSTSHPCITFDKWRYITIIDDHDNVIGWMKTEF
ncbi:amino acid deaminase [Vibrio sinensis]|uniref:Amino acid deaminase n=2 Tax=Vibrio sinensis TaxID=2302434 RepID=A0A3A6RB90_9VIBR|nr:amino acid deaminase [Vibrio sinensis]